MAKRLSVGVPPANSYPYPPLPNVVLNAAVNAIRRAWLVIAQEERSKPESERLRTEPQINTEMTAEIDALRRSRKVADFTPDVFETPNVDTPTKDFTGRRLGIRPDITIRLRDLRPGVANPMVDAIFVECKILKQDSNLGAYFSDGMKRFIDGEYAWASQQGVMMGYLETSQVLPEDLEQRLVRHGKKIEMQIVANNKSRLVRPSGMHYLAFTRHHRTWTHLNSDLPGDIELLHIWLSVAD